MSRSIMREFIGSPRLTARVAGVLYSLTILSGTLALVLVRGRLAANLIAAGSYVAVTVLFYYLFKPVNRNLSLLAAAVSLGGCVVGALSALHLAPFSINPLVFFGFYCLLIGYLIFRSTFLPRFLGALMAIGGLGWMTFVSASLAQNLFPYNLAPGILGEGTLTLWLLIFGVNAQCWKEQAQKERNGIPSVAASIPPFAVEAESKHR
jgi:hypothetical protein